METAHHCHQPAGILASTAPLFQCKYLPAQSTPISTLHSSTTHRKDATSQFSDSFQFNKSYLRLYQTHDKRHLSTGSSYFPHPQEAGSLEQCQTESWATGRDVHEEPKHPVPGRKEGSAHRDSALRAPQGKGGCQKHTRASLERGSNWSNYR